MRTECEGSGPRAHGFPSLRRVGGGVGGCEQVVDQGHGSRDTAWVEQTVCVRTPGLPLTGCVTSGKLLNLSVAHFLITEVGEIVLPLGL